MIYCLMLLWISPGAVIGVILASFGPLFWHKHRSDWAGLWIGQGLMCVHVCFGIPIYKTKYE